MPESGSAPEVQRLYQEYLARHAGPERIDFEVFCARHPAAAAELRRLHLAHSNRSQTRVVPPDGSGGDAAPNDDATLRPTGEGDSTTGSKARYRLEGEIARGGMGAILKVWDSDLHRPLAMKVILAEDEVRVDDGSTADVRLARFLEEAQITGQLDHPGVVPVHELGIDTGGRVYFTMRLVKGRDLGEIIDKVRAGEDGWSLTRALNVLHRVCETMAYAHAKGVVHRDLKPENIMVGQFGETYAMDWGLARVMGRPDGEAQRRRLLAQSVASIVRTDRHGAASGGDADTRTQDGAILGTPFYMPPEQAAGELETIGPHSDIYAVGAILYHLLTGRRPYEQLGGISVMAVVRAVLEGPPVPVHRLEPKVPPELVAICERAMGRAPTDRYPSMVAMAADLQAFLEGRVVHAYRTGAVAEFGKWVRRNRAFSAALAGLILVAAASLVAFALNQSERAVAIAAEQERTRAARDEALVNLEQAQEQAYVANVIAADASLAAGEIVEAKRHLANCVESLRDWEWLHLSLAVDASTAVLDVGAPGAGELAVDRTGRRLVTSAADGSLRLWNLEQRGDAIVLAGAASADRRRSAPAIAFFDGDRQIVAVGRQQDARLRTFDAASGELTSQLTLTANALYAVAVSPQGDRVAVGAADHSIHVVDRRTGDTVVRLVGHADTLRALAFSSEGTRLASGAEDRTVRSWNVADGTALGSPIQTAAAVHSLAFRRGDDQLAAGLENGEIWRFEGETGAQLDRLEGHRGTVYDLAFAADGSELASASFDKTVRIWRATDGRLLATLVGHEQAVHGVRFTGAGGTLASCSADGTARLWDIARRRASLAVRGLDDLLAAVDVDADGSRAVIGSSWPGTVEVIDAVAGTSLLQLRGPEDSVVALAFAPSGPRFAVAFAEESSVRIADLESGTLGPPMLGHEASPTAVAWSRDGATVLSGAADRTVRAWDPATGDARGEPLAHASGVTSLAVLRDGSLVTATLDGAIAFWDLATGTRTRTIDGDGLPVFALAAAPDGGTIAAGYGDGTVRLFATAGSLPPTVLAGHEQRVSSLRFLPSGTRLVSGSFDGTVRVWDTAHGRLALTLRDHDGPVTAVAVDSLGAAVVSTSQDGTLRIRRARRDAH